MASTSERSEMMFSDFCALCDKISKARREKRTSILRSFISKYKASNEASFYRVLRLLLPQYDRERAAYGFKEFSLAKIYIRILSLNPESKDALKLKDFRAPKSAGNSAGDFAEVAFWVLKSRCYKGNQLTLDQVHRHLDAIALHHANKKPREKDKELEIMLHNMSAQEQKWLLRILLKEMKLGLGHAGILSAYHPDAREFHDFNQSLQQVCEKLNDPARRLHEIEVELFSPCAPMLAERCDVQDIGKHFARRPGPRYVETKLDGERSQLHYSDGQFKFFSRNAFEFTDSFGSTGSTGSLSPYLAKQLKPNLKNCILDGEMMPYNTKYKIFGSKGMNLDVKTLRVGNVHQPCFCAFDVLYYNDVVLTNKPLTQRLEMLKQIFTPLEGIIMYTPQKLVNSEGEVLEALNAAIDNFEEGIVVKEPDSIYKPKARNDGWIKIKPEYTPGAMVELDLLIVGGYYGEGKRRGIVSHFLLAVAQPPTTPGGDPSVFESVTRVGSGCTMDELAALGEKLKPYWKKTCPGNILCTREKPQLWIEACNSVILQVKASEVVRSDLYYTGYTLRFPRIEKVRYDKPWADCLSTEEFNKLRETAGGSLVVSHITQRSPQSRKRRAVRAEPTIAPQFCHAGLDRVKSLSQLLAGKEICVLTGLPCLSKQDLECKVRENGGEVVLNPATRTFCVIVGEEQNIRVRNVCVKKKYDVVRAEWLLACVDSGQLLPWTPADLVCATTATSHNMSQQYDRYGDSYTDPASQYSLQHALTQVGKKEITLEQMSKLDQLLFNGNSPFSVFRGCVAYFDCYKQVGDDSTPAETPLNTLAFDFKFQCGQVSKTITSNTTHIILHSSELDRLEDLIQEAEKQHSKAYVVQHYWLIDCVDAHSHLAEDKYILHQW